MATIVNKVQNPEILTIDDMDSVYQKINPEDLAILSIKAHNHTITFESQMQTKFRDIALNLQPNEERGYTKAKVTVDFENSFLGIFYSTQGKILLKQIKDEDELVGKLLDFDNWSDTVISESSHGTLSNSSSDVSNTGISYMTNKNLNLDQLIATDRNSQGLIKLKDEIIVQNPNFANSNIGNVNDYGKSGRRDTGKTASDSIGVGITSSKTGSSNTSKDVREMLRLGARDLRATFLGMFTKLFRW